MLAASLNSRSTLNECSIKGPDFVKGSVSREVAQRARVLGLVEAHLAGAWHLETGEQPPAPGPRCRKRTRLPSLAGPRPRPGCPGTLDRARDDFQSGLD